MQKYELLKMGGTIYRILMIKDNKTLMIDCVNRTMPRWYDYTQYSPCSEEELMLKTNVVIVPEEELEPASRCYAYKHYTMIAGILPFIGDEKERSSMITRAAEWYKVSKQTIRYYLCLYLSYQNISVLSPRKKKNFKKTLTDDEKNIRWALNKYFYTQKKNSLKTAYIFMLKEKYCDTSGELLSQYPSFYQFRYYYRKHKKMENYYISRDGIKNYQRNHRPLLGDGIQEFAPAVGVGMLDATVCDIYLVNELGELVGRPILTVCVDAYSGLCCGYSLSWEGGVYSLRNLMINIITNKPELCRKHGISIKPQEWNCTMLPATLITDMGKEYVSNTFEQIADLGVTIVNLPPYRPELKGAVEKFFDVVQGLYKPYLKGMGVIESDYRERGAHDYRKDARMTMADFEKIILRCIIYYNNHRIVNNFPYTEKMLADRVKPYASDIWNYGLNQSGANLIPVDRTILVLTLLPRTNGKFRRNGLIVNKLRYKNDKFTERYLSGGTVTVAYNPEDVADVWLIENGIYTHFTIIEKRFCGKCIQEVETIIEKYKTNIKDVACDNVQAKIDLMQHIEIISTSITSQGNISTKGIRDRRTREQRKTHIDYVRESMENE